MTCFISSQLLRYSSFVLGFLARGFELRVNLGELCSTGKSWLSWSWSGAKSQRVAAYRRCCEAEAQHKSKSAERY
jgi:hypothetical protein